MTKAGVKTLFVVLYIILRGLIKMAIILFLAGLWFTEGMKYGFIFKRRPEERNNKSLVEHFTGFPTDI